VIDAATSIVTDEYHTGGEPYRIVTAGAPTPVGATVLDRRGWCQANLDDVRALLVNEPRGHADMYGCFVTPPDPDSGRDGTGAFGMVFFHKDGFSTACGHGTIAGVTWAIDTGRVPVTEPTTEVYVDVPSGRLRAIADIADGRVRSVSFENVPSFVTATDQVVEIGGRQFTVDVSYGGAFYASADVAQLGLTITPEHLPSLIDTGRAIKWAFDEHAATRHPDDARLSGCYGTIWFERVGARHGVDEVGDDGTVRQRNVTIFADGEVDRSPCGSGTSARLAVLDHRGELTRGAVLRHESIVGSRFTGRVLGEGPTIAGLPTVRTEVGGRAHRTGTATFTYDPDDELGLGFQLR
jgi:proline racemase/trans-L-3-hydroxyproline dehydratase